MDSSDAASESIKCYPQRAVRWIWLFLVGNTLLGCKDTPPASQTKSAEPAPAAPATPAPTPAPPPAPAGTAAVSAPARPTLDIGQTFATETEDAPWAEATEKAIRKAAPELADVQCHREHCQGTITAATTDELAAKTDRLQADSSLRGTGAKNILLTAPTQENGKQSMKIYVRYER